MTSAFWLNEETQKVIVKTLQTFDLVQNLSQDEQRKLHLLLLIIPYAEWKIELEGRTLTSVLKKAFQWIPSLQRMSQTLSPWSLHVLHAKKFNLSEQAFRQILKQDQEAIHYVIRYIVNHIGLYKPFSHIIAEYNIKEDATIIAAIQKSLNILLKTTLIEDGLMGPKTIAALYRFSPSLASTLQDGSITPCSCLAKLQEATAFPIAPFIPNFSQKRTWKNPIHSFFSFKKQNFLQDLYQNAANHIDVRNYVKHSLNALQHLSSFPL